MDARTDTPIFQEVHNPVATIVQHAYDIDMRSHFVVIHVQDAHLLELFKCRIVPPADLPTSADEGFHLFQLDEPDRGAKVRHVVTVAG